MIDKNKTFENYVVNENNSFAVYLAKEIVNSCADGSEGMNLYLYGKPGSGKTHLLQAIGNRCEKDHVVVSTTAELFMNDFVGHLRNQTMGKFREKYRTCDLLLMDDFEYIQGKEQTQEELYLTLAERIMQKRKFVIASRIPLNSIEIAYPNLETLLYGCIISELKAPADLNMESIIQNKCKELNLDLEKEIIYYIKEKVDGNISRVDGILQTLYALKKYSGQEITLSLVRDVVAEYVKVDESGD